MTAHQLSMKPRFNSLFATLPPWTALSSLCSQGKWNLLVSCRQRYSNCIELCYSLNPQYTRSNSTLYQRLTPWKYITIFPTFPNGLFPLSIHKTEDKLNLNRGLSTKLSWFCFPTATCASGILRESVVPFKFSSQRSVIWHNTEHKAIATPIFWIIEGRIKAQITI